MMLDKQTLMSSVNQCRLLRAAKEKSPLYLFVYLFVCSFIYLFFYLFIYFHLFVVS